MHTLRKSILQRYGVVLAVYTLLTGSASATSALPPLVLTIQPILGEVQTKKAYQPLADFIARTTGRQVTILTMPNFFAYWDTIRRGKGYDFALDAAHFTDYRIQKLGFEVLAKIPDSVSYSLVVSDQNPIFDPGELVARRVATFGIPSIGAARMHAMFPNPSRQPVTVEVNSAEEGIKAVLDKKVVAAIMPTPIVSQQMANGGGLSVVAVTEPIPHVALSAGAGVTPTQRNAIRKALLNAHKSDEGKEMLRLIGFERFDPATPAVYANQSNILKEYWGY